MRHQNLTRCSLSEVCTRYWTGGHQIAMHHKSCPHTGLPPLSAATQLSKAPLDLLWAVHLGPGKVVVVKFVRGARKVEMVLSTKCVLPTCIFWAPFFVSMMRTSVCNYKVDLLLKDFVSRLRPHGVAHGMSCNETSLTAGSAAHGSSATCSRAIMCTEVAISNATCLHRLGRSDCKEFSALNQLRCINGAARSTASISVACRCGHVLIPHFPRKRLQMAHIEVQRAVQVIHPLTSTPWQKVSTGIGRIRRPQSSTCRLPHGQQRPEKSRHL